jgi:glucose/arabinose dehydrogenase
VQHIKSGAVQGTALDLAVNSASERGLLGIALHPRFPADPGVYLYWTESTTGADSGVLSETPLLGNRVDRFEWDGTKLVFDQNLIQLRALQPAFAAEPTPAAGRGNHDGGVIRFGPDGKLYIYIGDVGRRGQMQNLPDGPGCQTSPCPAIPTGNLPDDQFGGPEPDNAHLTGVVLRLNDDGTTPADNPFFRAGELRGGEAGANLQKVFAYGIRNGFGMAFDPKSGNLWEAQNGDDSFTELNLVEPGANLGWIQIMGPVERLGQFKSIETTPPFVGLQQARWSPTRIADTVEEALSRLFTVYEGGSEFRATMVGSEENPPVVTTAAATAEFKLNDNGTLSFRLVATVDIQDATQAHIHLGADGQNGPVVAFLFGFVPGGVDFEAGDVISEGTLTDANIIARPGFTPTVANFVERMRQGRTYTNLHTVAFPGGEVRGQNIVTDAPAVSHYSDPEFSWKFEVAPAGIGFLNSRALGPQYEGDLFVGAARTFLEGGHLFHFNLTGNRRKIAVDDPRLEDRVADNLAKFEITESESLLFGRNFGIGTDIQTGPNGNLYVVSLSNGAVYEIHRPAKGKGQGPGAAAQAAGGFAAANDLPGGALSGTRRGKGGSALPPGGADETLRLARKRELVSRPLAAQSKGGARILAASSLDMALSSTTFGRGDLDDSLVTLLATSRKRRR